MYCSAETDVDYSRIKGKKSEDQGITQTIRGLFPTTSVIYISGLPPDVTVNEVRRAQPNMAFERLRQCHTHAHFARWLINLLAHNSRFYGSSSRFLE